MKILRTLKLKKLNGEFTTKEDFFFSFFDNLEEKDMVVKISLYKKGEYAHFLYNRMLNIFWMDYNKGFCQFLKRYNLNPLEAKPLINRMLKKHLGIDVRLSTNLPEEYERYNADFCNNEA